MTQENLKYWMALKSITGIGNASFFVFHDRFGSIENVFSAAADELAAIPGINKKTSTAIAGFKEWGKIQRELDIMNKADIKIITYLAEFYPKNLSNVYDRPAFIYVKGSLKKEDINIAIVGSRLASTYGKYTTERISRELAHKGITIVSGMARGIDSAAHRGAISAQGRTIAVLGSGLDIIYPLENKKLFDAIVENGAVISEFPLGTPPRSHNFPARNRIISGMSYGVLVVEAGEKSGSLITARLALEQGREVFAVPGNIDASVSRGTNKLIKQGAKLIENSDDILEEIFPQLEQLNTLSTLPISGTQTESVKKHDDLNKMEKTIIKFISHKNIHIDELISATGLSPADILSALMTMELKGLVVQHPGKFFSLK